MIAPPAGPPVLTVSELNRQARLLLEERFNIVRVRGEVSNFRRPASGHWYFTLKDAGAQLDCAMFVNRNRHVRQTPRDGLEVIVRGRVSLFEARGSYQILVDAIEPAGEGALRAAFEALKQQLAAEGLFAAVHKKALPALPRRLAVISSASGAALADVLAVLARRYPLLEIVLLPVAVQGEEALAQVLRALERAPATGADVVLLTRGGGSLEDLWTFNLEAVARAVRACPVPTVVAIGHETDFTIAEFAADLRAPTPSAAAELIAPDATELGLIVARHGAALTRSMRHHVALARHRLETCRARLRDPRERLRQLMQRADDIEARLAAAAWRRLRDLAARAGRLERTRRAYHPARMVEQRRHALATLARRGDGAVRAAIARGTVAISALARTLRAVSPIAVLERGYAIVTGGDGRPLRSPDGITPGDPLDVRLARGQLGVEVRTVREHARPDH